MTFLSKIISMKYLSLTFCILISSTLISQSCFVDGITFSTQAQINNFSLSFPTCTEIAGDVTIEGNSSISIQSLTGLSQITSIDGKLRIAHNEDLLDLEGLENLNYLGEDMLIFSNEQLEDISALSQLDEIGGYLHIHTNLSLTNLTGLQNISSVGESLLIFDNDNLEEISALGQIATIGGSLTVAKNDSLTTLVGLENIFFGIADLRIFENPILSICSLPRICTYLSNGGNHLITGNAEGCSNAGEVSLYCLLASPCTKTNMSIHFNPIISGTYQAIEEINSSGTIPTQSNVNYTAGNCITFRSGFSVAKNTSFSAEIEDCGL